MTAERRDRYGDYIIWISLCIGILYNNSSTNQDDNNGSKVT